jgi:hypothetical protein
MLQMHAQPKVNLYVRQLPTAEQRQEIEKNGLVDIFFNFILRARKSPNPEMK